jgi:hypothetical protein
VLARAVGAGSDALTGAVSNYVGERSVRAARQVVRIRDAQPHVFRGYTVVDPARCTEAAIRRHPARESTACGAWPWPNRSLSGKERNLPIGHPDNQVLPRHGAALRRD